MYKTNKRNAKRVINYFTILYNSGCVDIKLSSGKIRRAAQVLLLFIVASVMASCEKYDESENSDVRDTADSKLVIRTMAVETGGDTEISMPVNVFVFDTSGLCVATSTMTVSTNPLDIKLPAGFYHVYAVAGADNSNYDIPVKETATPTSEITVKDGMNHGDIMTAQSSVVLGDNEENTLTLALKRKVMLIESVAIKNVPENVTGVSVTISPLYDKFLVNGEYAAANGYKDIVLSRNDADSKLWENKDNVYLLPASGNATVKISLTTSEGVKSYSYSCADDFLANYRINIIGTYINSSFNIIGTITGDKWLGSKNIDFTFNGDNTTSGDNTEPSTGNAPIPGTLYKDCYVLKSEKSGGVTTVTLMSTKYKDALIFEPDNQESIKAATDAAIAEISAEGITGWRLPSYGEMEYVYDNIVEIKSNLLSLKKPTLFDYYYYFIDNDAMIKGFCITNKSISSSFVSNKNTWNIRSFTTLTFND